MSSDGWSRPYGHLLTHTRQFAGLKEVEYLLLGFPLDGVRLFEALFRLCAEIFGVSSRFNRETVLEALRAGLDAYRKRPFIACDYREIGEAFPVKGA